MQGANLNIKPCKHSFLSTFSRIVAALAAFLLYYLSLTKWRRKQLQMTVDVTLIHFGLIYI